MAETLDNELILFDRVNVIKDTINHYGAENFYVSFSGGKDSTVLHYLIDMALPGNQIPRVYCNTGIEYNHIVEFVKELAANDERFVIIKPQQNIRKVLETYGYPFKSKMYAQHLATYQRNTEACNREFERIRENPELLNDYDYIHNLPNGVKFVIKEYYAVREREREVATAILAVAPNVLKYQFKPEFNLKISDKCCLYMKEKPMQKWEKEHGIKHKITGIRAAEGGRREQAKCKAFSRGKLSFNPLVKVTNDWEEWLIDTYHIKLCDLYYEPFNFTRTGCKGCPFALTLQEQLETMEKYLPTERKQCEIIWKPVYDEYRRIGYRLKKNEQLKLL